MIHFNYHSYNLLQKGKRHQLIYLTKMFMRRCVIQAALAHQILRFYSTLDIITLIVQGELINRKIYLMLLMWAYFFLFRSDALYHKQNGSSLPH